MDVEDFAAAVKRLAHERGLSVSEVGYRAFDPDVKGTNPDTFRSVMAKRRRVTIPLMEAVAKVLDVPPEDFLEYRLAQMRAALDEGQAGGLEAAAEHLRLLEAKDLYDQINDTRRIKELLTAGEAAVESTAPAASTRDGADATEEAPPARSRGTRRSGGERGA